MTIPDEVLGAAPLKDVSRETLERLATIVDLLQRWNRKINLVAPATIKDVWVRHVLDSAQIVQYAPDKPDWVDLGSGAGFPGLIVAALLADQDHGGHVTMIESDKRKAAFIAEAARQTGLVVKILTQRIESEPPRRFDVVSARALAPLPKLLGYAEPYLSADGVCLFLKGETAEDELTAASGGWHMKAEKLFSLTDPAASILRIEELARAKPA